MRILHVAPVWLPVSVESHGGVETFVAELVRAQQELGHDVTLVGAGGSDVPVRLVEAVPEPLVTVMERGKAWDYQYYEQDLILTAVQAAAGADVVHSHLVPGGLLLDGLLAGRPPVVHTLHGQVTQDFCSAMARAPHAVVAVSHAQQAAATASDANFLGVVPNGINFDLVRWSAEGGEQLLFLGRLEPHKGPDLAIQAARDVGIPIVLAGPITDRSFFTSRIEPELGEDAEYVGILGREEKFAALAASACLLAPSRWAEPFGMVAVEAMATGTPVVGLANGALPEVVDDGVTGRVVDDAADLKSAVVDAFALDRRAVREAARERFDISKAAINYVAHYQSLIDGRSR